MSDIQENFYTTSQISETSFQNLLRNLSLRGPLVQRRQRSLEHRMLQRSNGQYQLSPLQPPRSLPQDIRQPTHISPSASPSTSLLSPTRATTPCSPSQQAYHDAHALYSRTHIRLTLLTKDSTDELRRHQNHNTSPLPHHPRDPHVCLSEKEQEKAGLLERLDVIAQGIQDLSEDEDGVWGPAASLETDGEEEDGEAAAAGSAEVEESSSGSRLSDEEINEAIAEAWRDVYPELELCRFPLTIVETGIELVESSE